jgi:hypothetical protein
MADLDGPTEVERITAPEAPPPVFESQFIGTLEFSNEYPTPETVDKLYDQLDFQRACQVFLRNVMASSMFAFREGLERDLGITSATKLALALEPIDARTLLLTPNSETVYGITYLRLAEDGPTVVEAPPAMIGVFNDMWMREVGDIGAMGPDQGKGGKYLVVPPGHSGELPDGEYFVVRPRTYGVWVVLRGLLTPEGDATPAVEAMRATRIYPLSDADDPPPTEIVNFSQPLDTIHPIDIRYFEDLARLVDEEHEDAIDPETAGMMAAIGIEKGVPFEPDRRMTRILEEAARVGGYMALAISFAPRSDVRRYDDRQWMEIGNTGYPEYRQGNHTGLDGISLMGWFATVTSKAMVKPILGAGSVYMWTFRDGRGEWLSGDRSYTLRLPAPIPAKNFWSVVVYDVWTRSLLANGQRAPSLNSYSGDLATNDDGSVDLTFGPDPPADGEGNWIRTVPEKGWFTILRLYGPLEAYFDASWKPSDIEAVAP